MSDGFRLGRWFGTDTRADSSWIAIAALLFATFAMLFMALEPQWSPGVVIAGAVAASLLVIASVVAREIARLIAARWGRVRITHATVFLVGTVSRTARHAPTRPRWEIAAACIGPLVHFALAFAMVALSLLGRALGDAVNAQGLVLHATAILAAAGITNAAIGLLDLVPALPLDGGHVLRALLWSRLGDRARATAIAVRIARGIAITAIVVGVLVALGVGVGELRVGGLVAALWLTMLGWAVLASSSFESAHALGERRLRGVRAGQLMRPAAIVAPSTSLSRVVTDELIGHDAAIVAVCDATACLGVLRLEQIRRIAAADWETTDAGSVMTPLLGVPQRIARTDDAADALRAMEQTGWHALPVLSSDGRVVGVIDRRDLVRWMAAADEEEEEAEGLPAPVT